MMLQPGLEAKDCPNYETCGSVSELTPEEEVDLIRVREVQRSGSSAAMGARSRTHPGEPSLGSRDNVDGARLFTVLRELWRN
jgi:hypothetical protein